jgi:dihydroneopterin aldolase
MLTVSLHGIRIQAPIGLYKEEHVLGNTFEVDVDVWAPTTEGKELPFIDYTILSATVAAAFKEPEQILEALAEKILTSIKSAFPISDKVRVCIRKLNPPMAGCIQYAQVCLER